MSGNHDSTPRRLDGEKFSHEEQAAGSMAAWVKSIEDLMATLEAAPISPAKKDEILHHMNIIRNELTEGRWPEAILADASIQVAHEVGDLDQFAQEWQVFSIRLAQWVKTVSDALGVK